MLRILEEVLEHEQHSTESSMLAAEELKRQIDAEREELKTLAKQKVRDIARHKDNAEILEELIGKWKEEGYGFGTLDELFSN